MTLTALAAAAIISAMIGKPEDQFSLTRGALSKSVQAARKKQFPTNN
jgi:hypothetical protein